MMFSDANSSSARRKCDCCPIPKTHRRIAEAHLLWHQTLDRYYDLEAFRANLNATIEALRNVTFVLQNERSRFIEFDMWYGPWQVRLKANTAAKWLHDARTTVVHQGELDSHSKAEVRLLNSRDDIITRLDVPPEIPSTLVMKNRALLNLLGNSLVEPEELVNSAIAIERRWSTTELGDSEILEALAQAYGLLSDMVLDAHIHLGQCECIPTDTEHSDFRSTYQRTGTLECMASGPDRRTQIFRAATGDEIGLAQMLVPANASRREAILRYELDENDKLPLWETLDPARVANKVLHSAKRILRRDRNHARMMFIRDGHSAWHHLLLEAADKAEMRCLMHIVARFVETKGCDAIVEVGEIWTTPAESRPGLESKDARFKQVRGEALFVMVTTREGFSRTYITPFRRGPVGGVKLGKTQESDPMQLRYLQPVLDVWRRHGYTLLGDGKVRQRIWEPDPLDACFCGAPKRFAECCSKHIPLIPNNVPVEVDKAISASDFPRAEEISRAALAQYVIWVKQHTAGMMNVAPEAYKMFVDIDVRALQGYVLTVQTALDASGRGELFVPMLRQLTTTIGVPRLSIRLVALASQWLMSAGRIEESILELDGLGDLEKVDDTLALITAARIHDYPPHGTKQLLLKAISSAVKNDEKWLAQLALAEHFLDAGKNEEARQLVDIVIVESGRSKNRSDVIPEALILRWRITKEANDFDAALEAMRRGDDAGRRRYGGILIDEGRYLEAEQLLSGQIEKGDPIAKLLVVDARVRYGSADSARDLLISLQPEQIPDRLKYAYAIACSIVALSSQDAETRMMAVRAIHAMPPSAQEGDEYLRTLMQALNDISPAV